MAKVTLANDYGDSKAASKAGGSIIGPSVVTNPYTRGYLADAAWNTQVLKNRGLLTASRAQLETYYKYLPPLTRGKAVPNGYPILKAGADGALTNTFPRIVSFQDTTPSTAKFTWTNPNASAAWTGAILTAYPQLKKIPKTVSITFGAMLKDKDTSVVISDTMGKPTGWYNKRLNTYFTVEPHLLFDQLFHAGKIFADPSAYFWQQTYSAWLDLDFFESLRNLAEALLLAVGIAYAAAAIVGQGTAATGTTSLESTSITTTPASSAALPTVAQTSTVTSTSLESVAAPAEEGTTLTSTLESTAAGAAAVNAATGGALSSALKKALGGAVALVTGKPASTSKTATGKPAASTAPSPTLTYVAIAAGAFAILGLVAAAGG